MFLDELSEVTYFVGHCTGVSGDHTDPVSLMTKVLALAGLSLLPVAMLRIGLKEGPDGRLP